MRESRVNE
jgi:capsular polysaccharide biosynthesis protein